MIWLDHTSTVMVNPRDVDLDDRTSLVPCYADIDPLAKSIERVGILTPVLLQERPDGRLTPVLGRRRIQAAGIVGISEVKARIASGSVPETELFSVAFWDNIATRVFDSATKAYLVRRILELFPVEVAARDYFPAMGVPAEGFRFERLRVIGGLEENILEALAAGRIHEKTAALLAEMDHGTGRIVMDLAQHLRLNANKSAEVISHLFDLSVFHGRTIRELLQDKGVEAILKDDRLTVQEKAERFRSLVRGWKFPDQVENEQQFRARFGRLVHSNRISVRPTSFFEDEGCAIEIKADSWLEAENILKSVQVVI